MIFVALIHFPVLNRKGEVINSAVTNLDMHDIARAARTYGVHGYYVATPLEDQQKLAADLAGHWLKGIGGEKNPDRKNALGIIRIVNDIEEVIQDIEAQTGRSPEIYATSAVKRGNCITWQAMRERVQSDGEQPFLILFGTASGLADEALAMADGVICPISGPSPYNHLSVRSAASITLDRLAGI
jgi:hypothetical protein